MSTPVNLSAFLPEVMLDVVGCPDSVAENAVKQAAIEFCGQSGSWTEQIDSVTTVQSTAEYLLEATAIQTETGVSPIEILAVRKVQKSGSKITLPTMADQHADRYGSFTTEDEPRFFNAGGHSNANASALSTYITFFPTPDAAYTYDIWAILKPAKTVTQLPHYLYNDWLETIAHGAKARLKAMSGRPWADPAMVGFHRKEFINGYVEARIRETKSGVQSSTVVAPRAFGFYRFRRI